MATVKGDVHDIGKNIVGVVLGCNNYRVIDLGVMVPAETIVETAIRENVDVIGLSGLITPSLDEMVHVAKELARRGVNKPVMIGGATTSRVHTAVKIAPVVEFPVIHVLDASKAVPVVGSLLHSEGAESYLADTAREYEQVRTDYARRTSAKSFKSLEEARANRLQHSDAQVFVPNAPGVTVRKDVPLETLRHYIDWTPFFLSWELKGRYPAILTDPIYGEEATKLFSDAQNMLDQIISSRSIRAHAVSGLFPAVRDTDNVIVNNTDVLHFLRQQTSKAPGLPNLSLADFVYSADELAGHGHDYMGAFVVTAGDGVDKLCYEFEQRHDDYSSIMVKALADRLAEACAEWLHERIRRSDWGYAASENLSNEERIAEQYQGIRPAPGYAACPDHTEKLTLFRLLDAQSSIGVSLTESMAMSPASSVSGWYFSHPTSRYFAITAIQQDQLIDYAARKGWTIEQAERWLAPLLQGESA